MKYKRKDQIERVAAVERAPEHRPMTRRDRLERWAEILEREPQRWLRSLSEIEFVPRSQRNALQAENSPVTIAFQDPVLRVEGLTGETLGDAISFFDLSEREAHHILCSCRNGLSMTAGAAARNVRQVLENKVWSVPPAWLVAGALTAAPFLLLLAG